MPKFQTGDKVKIVKHPTQPDYCGLEGKVSAIHEGLKPNTRGVAKGDSIPQPDKQWKYDIQIDCPPPVFVYYLDEEWIELVIIYLTQG